MQNRSYASVKKPIPAMMIAVKWYHCVFATSSAFSTWICSFAMAFQAKITSLFLYLTIKSSSSLQKWKRESDSINCEIFELNKRTKNLIIADQFEEVIKWNQPIDVQLHHLLVHYEKVVYLSTITIDYTTSWSVEPSRFIIKAQKLKLLRASK